MENLEGAKMKNNKLDGLVVVITGGSNGIGKATGEYLFKRGANVVIADLSVKQEELLKVYIDSYVNSYKRCMLEVPLDVRNADNWNKLLNAVIKEFGKVDVLINCAGIIIPDSLIQQALDKVEKQLDVNLLGPIIGSKVFLPLFKEQKKGHIINISSLAGIVPLPFESIYSASKFGLRGFSLALAQELKGSGIKVTTVCPDSVKTAQVMNEAAHQNANLSFSGSMMETEYVAKKICNTILHPKMEVLIPSFRGQLSKFFGNSSLLRYILMPILDKIGNHNRKIFLNKINNKEIENVSFNQS
jgi:3-oxoacyl-[acyl-carrier protein] reductase